MAKRSRDVSFSPSDDVASLDGDGSPERGESRSPAKLSATDMTMSQVAMQCSLPPHRGPLDFATIEDFELHYAKDHSNRCVSCGKNFPTAHFLTLHIDENHNTLREARQAKGEKTYACFVEDCDRMCSTPQKRRLHLIDKHLFPKIYNFRIVDTGIDKSTSMLREGQRRRLSTAQKSSAVRQRRGSTNHSDNATLQAQPTPIRASARLDLPSTTSPETAVGDLERSMSALQFVPPSVMNKQRTQRPSG